MRTFEHYEADIIACIKKNKIYTGDMIFTFYSGISRSQYFLIKLNESDAIKKELDDNKNRTKLSMLNKWFDSDNAVLQLALMKLLSTDDELRKLSMQHTDHTTQGEKLGNNVIKIEIVQPNEDE